MCAYQSDRWKDQYNEDQYAKATRAEALRMRDELNQAIRWVVLGVVLGQAPTYPFWLLLGQVYIE